MTSHVSHIRKWKLIIDQEPDFFQGWYRAWVNKPKSTKVLGIFETKKEAKEAYRKEKARETKRLKARIS